MIHFFKKIIVRKLILILSSFIYLNKLKIKKYNNFKIELDISEYTQNSIYFNDYDKNIRHFIKPIINGNEIFIDVGANVGFYSLFFSGLLTNGKIFSYEADKKNFFKLKKNIKLNNFKNISCFNFGISSYDGKAKLVNTSLYNEGGHYINTSKNLFNNKKINVIKVHKLDTLLKIKKKKVFIKIDVEGHEPHVLSGMIKILKNNNCILIIEVGQDKENFAIKKILKKYKYFEKKRFGINSIFTKKI